MQAEVEVSIDDFNKEAWVFHVKFPRYTSREDIRVELSYCQIMTRATKRHKWIEVELKRNIPVPPFVKYTMRQGLIDSIKIC